MCELCAFVLKNTQNFVDLDACKQLFVLNSHKSAIKKIRKKINDFFSDLNQTTLPMPGLYYIITDKEYIHLSDKYVKPHFTTEIINPLKDPKYFVPVHQLMHKVLILLDYTYWPLVYLEYKRGITWMNRHWIYNESSAVQLHGVLSRYTCTQVCSQTALLNSNVFISPNVWNFAI